MTIYRGPANEDLRRAWRQARRVAARRSHPDLGGDAAQFHRDLAEVDRRFRYAEAPHRDHDGEGLGDWVRAPAPRWQPAVRALRRARRQAALVIRTVRGQIPRGWPGSRRYFDL